LMVLGRFVFGYVNIWYCFLWGGHEQHIYCSHCTEMNRSLYRVFIWAWNLQCWLRYWDMYDSFQAFLLQYVWLRESPEGCHRVQFHVLSVTYINCFWFVNMKYIYTDSLLFWCSLWFMLVNMKSSVIHRVFFRNMCKEEIL
jgi:hypothetical protein